MQFGAQVSAYLTSWDDIRSVAQTMDAGRYSSIWFADHFVPPNRGVGGRGPRGLRSLDRWPPPSPPPLTPSASDTSCSATPIRNPGLVAKIAGSIDHISHGRFTLGIGASWFRREHAAYGWDFPAMKERQDRFEEACKLLRALLHAKDERVDVNGEYYSLDNAPLSPGSFDTPIPILVGGTGPRRTLRTLAMYGDILNLDGWAGRGMSVELLKEKVDILHAHCEAVGRDPAEIKITALMPCLLTNDETAAKEWEAARRPRHPQRPRRQNHPANRRVPGLTGSTKSCSAAAAKTTPSTSHRLDDEVVSKFA